MAETSCKEVEYHGDGDKTVVLVDCGVKHNIIRCLTRRGVKVVRVPWDYDFTTIPYDGLFISNGPGNPDMAEATVRHLRQAMEIGKPICGICMGNQLLAKAAGAKVYKLKYGHRGANQPVTDFESGRTFITSQNHGYAVVGEELPAEMGEVAQVNANDGTCEGIKYKKWNCFTVQFHPEANGGPKDTEFLFDRFLNNVKAAKEAR